MDSTLCELTAAGLFGIFTRFPFHPTTLERGSEQNARQKYGKISDNRNFAVLL